jgi:hypothetical protein
MKEIVLVIKFDPNKTEKYGLIDAISDVHGVTGVSEK